MRLSSKTVYQKFQWKILQNYFGGKADELANNNQNIVLDTLATSQSKMEMR